MSNYRIRRLIAGLVAVVALTGATVATTAPADAAKITSYVNGI